LAEAGPLDRIVSVKEPEEVEHIAVSGDDLMDRVVSLAKRRGLIFQSSEIYGGLRSSWDYGHYGVLFKNNVKSEWWRQMVVLRDDIVGLDAAIIMSPRVWEASGHVASFADPLVDCKECKQRFRADHIEDASRCPSCGAEGSLTEARQFNLMFKTYLGPVEDEASLAYLRPETAQGIFVDYELVRETTRKKPPFGIAQIGKAFRNEITPGNFTYRTREFEQMELEYFVPPDEAGEWFDFWVAERLRWYTSLGIDTDHLRTRPHDKDELSHYSQATTDIEYLFPWGWGELEGIANRTDFDLVQHSKYSGKDLRYYDQDKNEKYYLWVIEPSAGADRATLAFLIDAYREEKVRGERRVVLGLDPRLAPVKAAVLPLSKNPDLTPQAKQVAASLRPHFSVEYDETGSIGRRYRRQDEIGTPLCVTFDFESLQDSAVTIRFRDTMAQERVPIEMLHSRLTELLAVTGEDLNAGSR
jgi:glycyl-tRNA synthetase